MVTDTHTYQLVCGLEVHAELKTASKMFCSCQNDPFGAEKPNIYTCPVCLGMPGGLPVANETAIKWVIQLGLALNCKINLFSKFDRKHYFYPDLPKGYQISQYDLPFCYDGYLNTDLGSVRIHRIHLEEDTAKLQHSTIDGKKVSLVDFNRSGVPLVEIVTEADIKSPAHAKAYTKKLRQLLRYLEISDCDMEQGGMRLEANVSLRSATTPKDALPAYKVEVKNINSFRFLEQAISYEMQRQAVQLDRGETPAQETRGWNPSKQTTFAQRSKETAEDYRYLPDPDIPPLQFSQKQIATWRKQLPTLPAVIVESWHNKYGVEKRYADALATSQTRVAILDAAFTQLHHQDQKQGNKLSNQLASMLINKKIGWNDDTTQLLANFAESTTVTTLDDQKLSQLIEKVFTDNPTEATRFKGGETKLVNFFLGQILRESAEKLDANQVRAELLKHN